MIFLPSMMVKIVCIGDLQVVDGATEAHDIEMIHFPGSLFYQLEICFDLYLLRNLLFLYNFDILFYKVNGIEGRQKNSENWGIWVPSNKKILKLKEIWILV